jgi:hypothetical protein|tara:strand:+ start:383 stop:508 length:126 start_codon:yes stop_codon:yes gene_type:complete
LNGLAARFKIGLGIKDLKPETLINGSKVIINGKEASKDGFM